MKQIYEFEFRNTDGSWEGGLSEPFFDRNSAEKAALTFSDVFKEDVRFKADHQTEYQYVKYTP